MTGIEIHGDLWQVELLHGIYDTALVGILGFATLGNVEVGDKIGQAVGLNNQSNRDVGVQIELGLDGINVCLVLGETVISNRVLAVGGSRSTVTVRQIVDNEGAHDGWVGTGGILGRDVLQVGSDGWNFGSSITKRKIRNVRTKLS